MTDYVKAAGVGRGGVVQPSDAELAVWAMLAPWVTTRRALWLQAQPKGDVAMVGPADVQADAALFWMLDRASQRRFVAAGGYPPRYVTDSVTGRKVIMPYPAGPIGMVCAAEDDKPIFIPGVGYSFAARFRVPAPNTTMNAQTFGATVGRTLLGGSSVTAADNLAIMVNPDDGRLQVRNRYGTVSWQNAAATDYRDGAWHTALVSCNPASSTIIVEIDGAVVAGGGAGFADFATSTGADRVTVGGTGGSANLDNGFLGALGALFFWPDPASLADAANRTAMRALLATL